MWKWNEWYPGAVIHDRQSTIRTRPNFNWGVKWKLTLTILLVTFARHNSIPQSIKGGQLSFSYSFFHSQRRKKGAKTLLINTRCFIERRETEENRKYVILQTEVLKVYACRHFTLSTFVFAGRSFLGTDVSVWAFARLGSFEHMRCV